MATGNSISVSSLYALARRLVIEGRSYLFQSLAAPAAVTNSGDAPRASSSLAAATFGIAVVALWFLFHPYIGLIHDSTIYIGRALADLHPETIGQEPAYVHDGQSGFSLFPAICTRLVATLGPGGAGALLAASGLLLWILSAAYLFSRIFSGCLFWAAMLCLCVMPSEYGGQAMFHWGEAFATPRPFAEAAALIAVGALIERRFVVASGGAIVALALHPIMALGVLALIYLDLCLEDSRWLLAVPAFAPAALVGAFVDIPIVNRLFVMPDAAWWTIFSQLKAVVYLYWWTPADAALAICQFGTAILIWMCDRGTIGQLVAKIAIIAFAGIIVTFAVPTLLVLQMQMWRSLWVLSVAAVGSLPFLARQLWTRGRRGHIAFALMIIAWTEHSSLLTAAPCVLAAIFLIAQGDRIRIPRLILVASWSTAAAVSIVHTAAAFRAIQALRIVLPAGLYGTTPDFIGYGFQTPLIVGLAIAMAIRPWPRLRPNLLPALAVATVAALAVVLAQWDRRSPYERDIESGTGANALRAQINYGSVFWIGGALSNWLDTQHKAWLWTARPDWWDGRQGAGVIFDRALSFEWLRRLDILEEAHLAPWPMPSPRDDSTFKYIVPIVERSGLILACTARGGPDWIVAPKNQTASSAASEAVGSWRAPEATYIWSPDLSRMIAQQDYFIFECSRIAKSAG